jgi:hypothetical protein
MALQPGGFVQTTSTIPLGSDGYRRTLDEVLKYYFDRELANTWQQICPVLPKSRFTANGNSVEIREMYGGGSIGRIGEINTPFPTLNQFDGFRQVIGPREYAGQFVASNLAVKLAQNAGVYDVIREGIETLASGVVNNRADIMWSIMNNAANTTIFSAMDGQPLFSRSHSYKDMNTYSNLLPGNATFDTLRASITQMMLIEDHLGRPASIIRPGDTLTIWATPQDRNVIREAILTEKRPGTDLNDINTLAVEDFTIALRTTPWLKSVGQRRPVIMVVNRAPSNVDTNLPPVFMVDWGMGRTNQKNLETENAQGGVELSVYDVIGWGAGDVRQMFGLGFINDGGTDLGSA